MKEGNEQDKITLNKQYLCKTKVGKATVIRQNFHKLSMVLMHKRERIDCSILTLRQERTNVWLWRPRSGLCYWLERTPSMHLYNFSIDLERIIFLESFLSKVKPTRCFC